MLSFWEKESFVNYDVIIVGAGITGLSSAISLLEKHPGLNILILEKSTFPSGASTKNAGFACFGSLTELLSDINVMGESETLKLVQSRWNGLQILRSRFTDEELGYEALGGYELLKDSQIKEFGQLNKLNTLLAPIFNSPVFSDTSYKINEFGFCKGSCSKMLFNSFEGQINTGKTLNTLWKRAAQLGAKILTGSRVVKLNYNEVSVVNFDSSIMEFFANKIVVCTNAFTKELFPELDLVPGRGQVLITKPISNLRFKGTFHMEKGFYYFRNVGNRVLLGGGRHLDIKKEETTEHGINTKIESELLRILKNDLLPNTSFSIDQKWSGIMAFGEVKKPIVKWINPATLIAVRLGGMGMALGSELGEIVGDEILNRN